MHTTLLMADQGEITSKGCSSIKVTKAKLPDSLYLVHLLLTVIIIAFVSGRISAQFPLSNTHPGLLYVLNTINSGPLYIGPPNYTNGTRTVYDLNLAVYRILNFPPAPSGYTYMSMSYITEDLFDNDPATIEFMMGANGPNDSKVYVFREDGTQLFEATGAANTTGDHPPIVSTLEASFLLVQTTGPNQTEVYELPGQLPCTGCQGQPVGSDGVGMQEQEGQGSILLFPNPASSLLTIQAPESFRSQQLSIMDIHGRMVLTDRVVSGSMTIDIVGLAAGRYICMVGSGVESRTVGSFIVQH